MTTFVQGEMDAGREGMIGKAKLGESLLDGRASMSFEQSQDALTDPHVFKLTQRSRSLIKYEVSGDGAWLLRSKYQLVKREASRSRAGH